MTTSDRPRTRWGILSTGHIAATFVSDLKLLKDEADVVAVGSRNPATAAEFAAKHGIPRAYGSYAELAADADLDVVYVASTHNDHAPSARLCLEAGRAVLVEKPLTVTAAEAEDLLALARDRNLLCMEAVWTRTNPLIRRAAELVGSGELGAVRHLSAQFGFAFEGEEGHRLLDPAQAGGAILDLGVYPVHAAILLRGEPDGIFAYGDLATTGVDAHAAALLTYPATPHQPAATASIACSLATTMSSRLEVFTERGAIELDNFIRPASMRVWRSTDREAEPEHLITQWPGNGYTFQAQEVMRCLRAGLAESPLVPWADTLASMRTLDRWRAAVGAV